MGKYINYIEGVSMGTSFASKCSVLVDNGAVIIPRPTVDTTWKEGMVCVVDNGAFAAAAYAYSKEEMREFSTLRDHRPQQWYLFKGAKEYID